ncbi:MAG: hypothetical protein WCT85_07530, partial [Parachlamydiales bacterium]
MPKKDLEEYKDLIIDNLETLRINLENYENLGLEDFDESVYNEITSLIDETKSVDEVLGLEEIVVQGKTIETRLDSWLANQG